MRVYDFDQTIYAGDSTRDFYFYCLRHYPKILICLPKQCWHFLLYMLGFCSKTVFKEHFYRFLTKLPDTEKVAQDFWDNHMSGIKDWYLKDIRGDDVVISASPFFLLKIPCARLGIMPPIASLVDPKTGKYTGENCYGTEKPSRFRAIYSDDEISEFYSDSLSDTPMAVFAKKSFLVQGNVLSPWPK
ncbi:MAG: haloacid dehalogenase-like hydrolase [Clostridia bacterium]|nr:haloacid dehalogenase-like hydrolase [Clostridia bacterium]